MASALRALAADYLDLAQNGAASTAFAQQQQQVQPKMKGD
jgi:hypothetical protein